MTCVILNDATNKVGRFEQVITLRRSGTERDEFTLGQYTEHDEYNTPGTERDELKIPSAPVQLLLDTKILHVLLSHVAGRLLP